MNIINAKEIFNKVGATIGKAYQDADARYREQENQKKLQQIFNQAIADYPIVADIVATTIQNHADLGLLPPGTPDQLMIPNGVKVTANGTPIFRLVVRCATMEANYASTKWRRAFQTALDETCYTSGYPRLILRGVKPLPRGYICLALTWGCW